MRRMTVFLALICVVVFSISVFALERASNERISSLQVAEKAITEEGIDLTLNIEHPLWKSGGSIENPVTYVEFPAGGVLEIENHPMIPMTGSMFRLPPRSGVVIEVIEASYETFSDVDYAVYSGVDNPDEYIAANAPVDSWFPENIAEVSSPAIFHNFRVANLLTYPIQVNTARREVRVYNNIQVAIRYDGMDDRNAIDYWPTHLSESFLPWYRMFLDWDDNELDQYELYRGHVQVVMENDVNLWNEIEEWIEWKEQKGWILDFLTDDDVGAWSATNIKNELQDRWDESEVKFDYVVIIGDDSGSFAVNPGTSSGYGAGDLGYSLMAGNDDLPDVHVGRISVQNTTDIASYVAKVLEYERDPDLGNTDWYLRGCVAATSSSTGTSSIFVNRYCRDAMFNLGYTDVYEHYYNDGGGNVNTRDITSLNNGVSFYNHRGWLSTGLSSWEIENLNNDGETPIVFDVTCGTGNWSQSYGINEAWMRGESSVNNPNGAIGAMGTATSSTHTRFNNCLNGGTALSLLVLQNPGMGDALTGAKINLWNNFESPNPWGWDDFLQWLNLMGDPTVWIWTGIPQVLDVTASSTVYLGENSYPVTVTDDVTGDPIEGAWVTLYKVDDDETVIARGITESNGEVILDTPLRYSGTAKLTVTQPNYAPHRIDVTVALSTFIIGVEDIDIQDDGNDGTSGNGNSIPEAGETVGLQITARNYGLFNQNNVTATGSSTDPSIVSVSGTATFGNMNGGISATSTDLLLVEIDEEAQHDWISLIDIEFDGSAGTYDDIYQMTVKSAKFAMVEVDVVGVIDPGETGNLNITITNVGGSNASGTSSVELICDDPLVNVTQGTGTIPQMLIGQEAETSTLSIQADAAVFPGHQAHAILVVTTSSSQVDSVYITIPIGTRTTSDPTGPDSYGYYAFDNTDTDYEDIVPVFDWVEIDPNAPGSDYDGTDLGLYDSGDDNDDAVTIDLPFPIQYYGEVYTEATVCTNGWIAMGDQSDLRNQRNWTIPSPLGPNDMIAVFWDELTTVGGNADVFSYYDAPNDRFIVEWYNMPDLGGGDRNTFEIIFYDQVGDHITPTGDTEFLTQYDQYNLSNESWNAADVLYFTVGIENHTQTDGLLWAYWNSYTPGSANINDGRAILWTTAVDREPAPLFLTATPVNPPIFIQAWGGSFQWDAHVENVTDGPYTFDAWTEVILPNGSTYGPLNLFPNLTLPSGAELNASPLQFIPANAPNGWYSYVAKVGEHPDGPVASADFEFGKLPVNGPADFTGFNPNDMTGWEITGWFDETYTQDPGVIDIIVPNDFSIENAYPNPFNPKTTVTIGLPESAELNVQVYNVTGQLVSVLAYGHHSQGYHNFVFDANGLASGLYFVRATVPGRLDQIQKVMLVR